MDEESSATRQRSKLLSSKTREGQLGEKRVWPPDLLVIGSKFDALFGRRTEAKDKEEQGMQVLYLAAVDSLIWLVSTLHGMW